MNIRIIEKLKLYAIINSDGKYFHAKGMSGRGETWVDTLDKARIYPKISSARGQVTYFAKTFPKYDTPTIVILNIDSVEYLDDTKRVEEVINKDHHAKLRVEKARNERNLENAKKLLKDTKENIKKLKREQYDINT